ncbi:MAG: NUDIX domain-containing protein [Paludibacteraceae bacterium]|nr:NUDIX domain-containing protein [Paludibacteraceae bacterium]MBP5136182.1 NUDIX domain-containing protein [Paludibacteraceae bacterium]
MDSELFPVVNEKGDVIGKATRKECHSGSFLLHPVVHIHIFNTQGEVYLQHRSMDKDIQPGKWDTSVGGHIDYGEARDDAARRECREELGVEAGNLEFLYTYIWKSAREHELVYVYRLIYDGPFAPDEVEVTEGRFFSADEIKSLSESDFFTPNFLYDWGKLCDYLQQTAK